MLRFSSPMLFRTTLPNHLKVMVGVKRVVDYTVKVRVKDNKIQTANAKMSVNPFDEIAIEEAIKLKEKKIATEVIAVTVGNKKSEEVLRTAMALGCDKAIHIVVPDAEAEGVESLAVAQIFQKLHEEIKPDLWILGKQAVDGDFGNTSQLLAGLLDIPQGTFASEVDVKDKKVKVTREVDAGHQVLELDTPCVIAADLRLNTPRFPKLPNIMKARKKPIDTREVASLGVDIKPRLTIETVCEPEARKAGIKVKTIDEFYDKLHNEAKVI
ncbi:electron transfer flavoprotein beta subunit [Angomonas deanei]|uniref:Electron transfer flavoprotein subunit beta n=1 Tax=Angomonas deanei TaxID=59799 RepID=S9VDK8_9TRYP|nr:electron transfer flavoprotein beta subunit [Angomonas deanei]EPY43866.1 electron transfer flavoprotein beta subunit [Angomonas deanei]CAD2217139.1 Electron transfer flavoprotein domain containing protein, putative [Angomonas deanei]|eukprot:EPY41022.1 electron transfer flavoprotein beta subunit [Angomonas deanei]